MYTSNPKGPHKSIHIAVESDSKSAHIIDTTNGSTEHTDVKCYLTSACMKYFQENFDDNCYELTILRWFRDSFVSKEDIEHYYEVAPIIVETIDREERSDDIYNYIYDNIVDYCVEQIEQGNYDKANACEELDITIQGATMLFLANIKRIIKMFFIEIKISIFFRVNSDKTN